MPLHPVLALKRTTGNHWRARFTVKRWAGDSMAIPRLQARYGPDVAPDIAFFNHRQLRALHLAHSLRITSRADLRRPVLTALRVSPATVDTRSAAGHLTVTAKATDHRSGVSKIQVDAAEFASAGHTGDITSVTLKRQGMKWVGTMTFRQCVPAGSWQFTLFVFDHARNGAGYGPKRLSSLGLPAQITVRSNPQHLDAPAVNGATASAKHHTIRLKFSDGVKNVTPATLSGFALQPAATRFHSSLPITGITCSDGAGTADCSGTGGLVTSALLDVPDVAAGQQYEVFANIHSITSQLTDNFGNPLDWSRAAARVTVS
jgi:hypothetical protein